MKKILIILLFPICAAAQTRNIVPRADSEAFIGLSTLSWAGMYADQFYGGGTNLTGVIYTTATGSYPLSITGTAPAASVSAGSLGGSVIASSITLGAMYGAPTLTGTNFTAIPNAALVTPVIPSSATGTYPLSISGTATEATHATNASYSVTTSSDTHWNTAYSSAIAAYGWGNHALGGYANLVAVGASTASLRSDLTTLALSTGTLVKRSGDTMGGSLDLNGYNLSNVGVIYSNAYYGDQGTIPKPPISMQGDVVSTGSITGINFYGNGSHLSGVITSSVPYVPLAGGTMTGPLSLTGAGSYVTTASSISAASAVIGGNTFNGNFVSTGIISGNGSGLTALNAANVSGVLTVSSLTVTGAGEVRGILKTGASIAYGRLGQNLETNNSAASNFGGIALNNWEDNGGYSPLLDFNKSASDTTGTQALVSNGNQLGNITFRGSDGGVFQNAGSIRAEVDGTASGGDMPGRLIFATTPDGSTTLTDRMKIDNVGAVSVLGNAFSVGGSTLVVKEGNVGIGTTAPGSKLEVNGDIRATTMTLTGTAFSVEGGSFSYSAGSLTINNNRTDGVGKLILLGVNEQSSGLTFAGSGGAVNGSIALIGTNQGVANRDGYLEILGSNGVAFRSPSAEVARITSAGAANFVQGVTASSFTATGYEFAVNTSSTVTTATDSCTKGAWRFDANYIYVCTAANTWKRAALASWP